MSWFFGSSKASTSSSSPNEGKTVVQSSPADAADDPASKCPVDHSTRSRWLQQNPEQNSAPHPFSGASVSTAGPPRPVPEPPRTGASLSKEREVSSIPRFSQNPDDAPATTDTGNSSGKWVYPSPAQFFSALQRKNREPREQDMDFVVPIHNAVNERTWHEVLQWEDEASPDKSSNVQLVSFKGRPQDRTPRAWWKVLLGYQPPFDRHDWIIDRDGQRIRYVIDFYTGRGANAALPAGVPPQLAFYLDVRPAIDSFESVKMRVRRNLNRLFGLGQVSRVTSHNKDDKTLPRSQARPA